MYRTWKKNENSPASLNKRYHNRYYEMTLRINFPHQNHTQMQGYSYTNCNSAGSFAVYETTPPSLNGSCYDFL